MVRNPNLLCVSIELVTPSHDVLWCFGPHYISDHLKFSYIEVDQRQIQEWCVS